MSDPLKVSIEGPLSPWLAGFRDYLFAAGYAQDSVSQRLQLIAQLSRWIGNRGLEVHQLTSPVIDAFFIDRRATHTGLVTPRSLRSFLDFLVAAGQERDPDPPQAMADWEVLLERFKEYLLAERGLRVETVTNYSNQVRPFLRWRSSVSGGDFSTLSVNEVTDFLLLRGHDESVGSIMVAATALRVLLRWMFLTHITASPLATGVMPVAYSPYGALPKALTAQQLAAVSDIGVCLSAVVHRDQAIFLVLSRMALRSKEVECLCLEDFHWETGTVSVTGKGGHRSLMPLPVDVGEAIATYLQDERPRSSWRQVFLQSQAPHSPLGRSGISQVVTRRAARAGIEHRIGAHRLRHSAATMVLASGGSLTEAGQLLRHISPTATMIYAKVHLDALRTLAVPWPTALAPTRLPLAEAGMS